MGSRGIVPLISLLLSPAFMRPVAVPRTSITHLPPPIRLLATRACSVRIPPLPPILSSAGQHKHLYGFYIHGIPVPGLGSIVLTGQCCKNFCSVYIILHCYLCFLSLPIAYMLYCFPLDYSISISFPSVSHTYLALHPPLKHYQKQCVVLYHKEYPTIITSITRTHI